MTEIPSLAKQRRLHIIDDVAAINDYDKQKVERLRIDKTGAERIILGDDASFALGQWIAACEEDLIHNLQFALPPFPKTYVELTLWKVHKGISRPTSGDDDTSDDRVGFLINGKHVRTLVTARHLKQCSLGLFEYWVDTPESNRLMDGPAEREIAARAALLMGSSYHALTDHAIFTKLIGGTRIRCIVDDHKFLNERTTHDGRVITRFEALARNCAGELRTLWAVLLMLNQHRHHLQSHLVSRQAMVTPKGRKVYLAHTLITIPMFSSPELTRKTFYPNTRASPVGHRVRAHWRDYHKRAGCEHQWPLFPDEDGHFHCARCPGYRVRIENFHRGRSDEGYNLHTYEVVK